MILFNNTYRYNRDKIISEFENINNGKLTSDIGCRRKVVGCKAVCFDDSGNIITLAHAFNGPSGDNVCTGEVGNCGCSHAEPRLVRSLLAMDSGHGYLSESSEGPMLWQGIPIYMIIPYTPCTNCANIILDSNLFSGVFYGEMTLHDPRGFAYLDKVMPVISKNQLTREL